jgi:hypothetical protein
MCATTRCLSGPTWDFLGGLVISSRPHASNQHGRRRVRSLGMAIMGMCHLLCHQRGAIISSWLRQTDKPWFPALALRGLTERHAGICLPSAHMVNDEI